MNKREKDILEALIVPEYEELYHISPSFRMAIQILAKGVRGMVEEAAITGEKELERANNLAKEFEKYQL